MSTSAEEVMSKLETALAEMVRIDSTNPGLAGGPGEGAFAADLAARMERLGMEVDLWDVLPGRPNVVGRLHGRGTADMKCGFAAALTAVESLVESGERLAGDLLVAGVIDEEWESAGDK